MTTSQETTARDRPFNPFRVARSNAARAVLVAVRAKLDAQEVRVRKRRANDESTYAATVEALVADALYHWCGRCPGAISVPRSKAVLERVSRYRPASVGGTLPSVMDRLEQASFLKTTKGRWRGAATAGERSTMRAGPSLVRLARRHGIGFSDLGRDHGEVLVVLKGERPSRVGAGGRRSEAPWVEYTDDEAGQIGKAVAAINASLINAALEFDEAALHSCRPIDTHDRRLRRVFTRNSFRSGGRLFGGFWQELRKTERAHGLTIAGEQCVELDFSGMGPRLLYGIAGAVPTFRDAYALPGLERHRDGVKKVFNAEVFRQDGAGCRFPRETRKLFPPNISYQDVRSALVAAHPAVAPLLGTDVGHELQHQESSIMVEVLLRLGSCGMVGLPIHDAILVPGSQAAARQSDEPVSDNQPYISWWNTACLRERLSSPKPPKAVAV